MVWTSLSYIVNNSPTSFISSTRLSRLSDNLFELYKLTYFSVSLTDRSCVKVNMCTHTLEVLVSVFQSGSKVFLKGLNELLFLDSISSLKEVKGGSGINDGRNHK